MSLPIIALKEEVGIIAPSRGIPTTRQLSRLAFQCRVYQEPINMNTKYKRESENNQFNEVQKLAYIFGTKGRRSYSTNRVIRVKKRSEDPTREIMH